MDFGDFQKNPYLPDLATTETPEQLGRMSPKGVAAHLSLFAFFAGGGFFWGWVTDSTWPKFGALLAVALVSAIWIHLSKVSARWLGVVFSFAEAATLAVGARRLEAEHKGAALILLSLTLGALFAGALLARSQKFRNRERSFRFLTTAVVGLFFGYIVLGVLQNLISFPPASLNPIGHLLGIGFLFLEAYETAVESDLIEEGIAQNAPRYMEPYAAFRLVDNLASVYFDARWLLRRW